MLGDKHIECEGLQGVTFDKNLNFQEHIEVYVKVQSKHKLTGLHFSLYSLVKSGSLVTVIEVQLTYRPLRSMFNEWIVTLTLDNIKVRAFGLV